MVLYVPDSPEKEDEWVIEYDDFDMVIEPGQLEEEEVTEVSHYRRFSSSKKRRKNKTNKPRRGGKRQL